MKREQVLRKADVYQLITNLQNGLYEKATGSLCTEGKAFCCLGVWADQHGATWEVKNVADWVPIPKGRTRPEAAQDKDAANLYGTLRYGLTVEMLAKLASLNDANSTWKEVIDYLVHEVLPQAK